LKNLRRSEWIFQTLTLQFEIVRAIRKTYRRDYVEALIPTQFRELFVELVSGQRPEFARTMLAEMAKFDRDWGAVRSGSRLIRNLASEELLVAGDLGDRGPRIDRVIDTLMRQPNVNLLWGNHDTIWLGAHLGHEACLLTVLRFSARYRQAAQLEEGYGILTTALEKLVREVYADDPAERFIPKGHGLRDHIMVARMQKAMAVIQLKLEAQLIRRHPEWLTQLIASQDLYRGFTRDDYLRLAGELNENAGDNAAFALARQRRRGLLRILLRDVLGLAMLVF